MSDLRTLEPAPSPTGALPGLRRRVRLPLLAAALASVLLATVLLMWGFSRAADRAEVLVVTAPVEAGTAIPPEALSTTMIGADAGVGGFLPAGTDLSGLVAATDLSPGDVLSGSLVSKAPPVPAGWREVGAVLRPGRYPSTVAVGDEMAAVAFEGPGEIPVRVVDVTVGGDGALSTVLAVPPGDAATVGQWAATDRLVLVRLP